MSGISYHWGAGPRGKISPVKIFPLHTQEIPTVNPMKNTKATKEGHTGMYRAETEIRSATRILISKPQLNIKSVHEDGPSDPDTQILSLGIRARWERDVRVTE